MFFGLNILAKFDNQRNHVRYSWIMALIHQEMLKYILPTLWTEQVPYWLHQIILTCNYLFILFIYLGEWAVVALRSIVSLYFRRVMILLEIEVVASGSEVGTKIGSPQPFKPGQQQAQLAPSNNNNGEPAMSKPAPGINRGWMGVFFTCSTNKMVFFSTFPASVVEKYHRCTPGLNHQRSI